MLIPLSELSKKYNLSITGVLHLGAHKGEEARDYHRLGVRKVVWVEANKDLIPELAKITRRYKPVIIQAVVGESDGEIVTFNVSNNGQSSSVLDFGTHAVDHPEVYYVNSYSVETVTVDTLVEHHGLSGLNFLNMDLQGAELLALKGATEFLKTVDYIYSEVNVQEVYKDNPLLEDLDDYLEAFERVETALTPAGWGDAFWIRNAV